MDRDRFARLREILPRASELDPAARETYLQEVCAGDEELRREVEELLALDDADDFLHTGAAVLAGGEAIEDWFDPSRDAPPETIGPYRLHEELGRGGMGVVYRAEQTEPLRREVALKLVKRGMDTDAVVARFQAERQTLALMDHPNIARVLDAGATEDGRPYFVMELVRGEPITRFCDRNTLDPSARLALFLEVCRAVQHAHQRGVVHRDIKPSNVMTFSTAEGVRVKVIDFGIAKAIEDPIPGATMMTRAGQLLGTPEYMSPEQAGIVDHPVDTRTDVYSLGALLYELLSGRVPYRFTRYSLEEIQRAFRERDPLRPSTAVTDESEDGPRTPTSSSAEIGRLRGRTPERLRRELVGDLDNVVLMAMHKDPERRYASVDAFAEDIRRYRKGLPVLARADSWAYRSSKFAQRHALAVTFGALVLVFLIGFAAYSSMQSARIARERDRAVRAEAQAQAQAERAAAEAQTAREVSDFLVGLFEVVDPDEARGRTVTAREILEQGAQRLESELAEEPVVRARLMHTIGQVYQNLGLYDEARRQIEASLRLRREALGEGDPQVAESLVQLAWLLRDEGRSEDALPLLEQALAIQRAAYGNEHVSMNTTLYHLASVREDLGEYEASIELFREVLALDRKLLPEDDPKIAESLNNLAVALSGYGEYAEAEALYRESLAMNRRLLGDDHPEVATSMANLSNLVFNHVDREEGLALAREALAIRQRVLGDEHPHTAIAAGNLGIKLYVVGRHEEAETLLRDSLATKQRTQGERHPSTAHAWILLGLSQLGQDKFVEGETSFRTALDIFREVLPPGHNSIARSLDGLGRALMGQERFEEAGPLLEEALEIRRDALPAGHREIGDSLLRLGQHRLRTGRLAEAESLLLEAYTGFREAFGDDDTKTKMASAALAELYAELGDGERAEVFSRRADDAP